MTTNTAPESFRRVTELAASLENPHDRGILEVWRDHWWAEVVMDLDTIMATLAPNPTYRIYGVQLFGEGIEIDTTEAARAIYAQLIDAGTCPAGPFIDERFAFAPWGLMAEAVFTVFMPGAWLSSYSPEVEAEQLYEVCWRGSNIHPFDEATGLMKGEIQYIDHPQFIKPIDRQAMSLRLGWGEDGPVK